MTGPSWVDGSLSKHIEEHQLQWFRLSCPSHYYSPGLQQAGITWNYKPPLTQVSAWKPGHCVRAFGHRIWSRGCAESWGCDLQEHLPVAGIWTFRSINQGRGIYFGQDLLGWVDKRDSVRSLASSKGMVWWLQCTLIYSSFSPVALSCWGLYLCSSASSVSERRVLSLDTVHLVFYLCDCFNSLTRLFKTGVMSCSLLYNDSSHFSACQLPNIKYLCARH